MKVTLSDEQLLLLQEVYHKGQVASLKKAVKGYELANFQTLAVAQALITNACLFNIDTGLGKTLIAAGIINAHRISSPHTKWIYLCQCSNLQTTASKLTSMLYNSNVSFCDSTEQQLLATFLTLRAEHTDVLVLSYEAITVPIVESFLYTHRNLYNGFILDESQMLSNLSSHSSRLVSAIINSCTYKFALSATPLRINIDQVVNQVYMLDSEMFSDMAINSFTNQFKVWEEGRIVGYQNLEELSILLIPRVFSMTRSELGMRGDYIPNVYLC